MSEQIDKILIRGSTRYCRPQTLSEYQARSRAYLARLREIHPIFRELTTIGPRKLAWLAKDLSGLDDLIADQCYSPERQHEYLNTASDGRLLPGSLCRTGFSLTYCSQRPDDASSLLSTEQGGIDFNLRGCSASDEPHGDIVIRLPTDRHTDLHTPSVARRLLEATIDVWGCSQGSVCPYQYGQIVRERDVASCAGQWLFYLPAPDLATCLPADIRWESFKRGILIETTPHIPSADNPADIAAGRRVRDVLDEFGLVWYSTYAIEGWPPDREEWLYESFISGAPSDRKYTVHCINFDGYDADRNVLLYAKLFRPLRRQAKAWGLRGWDGPVLNEARRQVRAAAKAGGVPIEWHIGLEEPALRVRQLLADYTNITEQQLKVIHTPLEQALRSTQ